MAAAAAAAAVMLAINTGAVATMVALQRGRSLQTSWRNVLAAALPEAAGDYVLGFLVAWAIARDPWLLLPVAGGAAVVRQAVWGRAALAQREVELAQRESEASALRRADRLKDEFLGTISHELRTPLTVVCGFTELLLRRRPAFDPATHNQISYISDSGKHLARLVDDLLDFARLQRGALPVEPRSVDLAPLLARSVDELRARPGAERLATELPPALPAVADPERVTQIATNLLTNALKYAPEGPIILRAGTAPGGDAMVRVEVEDAGPGIAAGEQARIWEKFYRCASSSPGGAGIGLSVVRALAEAQGGAVGLWSAPGRGSRFWFDLPAATAGAGD
jgi:signal transduction histidine kinase